MPSSANAMTLTARMRRVSGDRCQRARTPKRGRGVAGARGFARGSATTAASRGLVVAVTVSNAIQSLDLSEIGVDDLELFAQPLDVAVDGAIIDVDVLAVSAVHQLIAAFDVARPNCERLQDEEFGDRQVDILGLPGALVPARIKRQVTALDDRLGLGVSATAGDLAAAQQRADALNQEALGKRLLDVIVGAHA